jgi:hypothetical protein
VVAVGFLAGYGNKPGVVYDGVNIAEALCVHTQSVPPISGALLSSVRGCVYRLTDAPSPRTTFFFHSTYA